MTHVLVTGASGFVGSALSVVLKARGDTVEPVSLRAGGAPSAVQVAAAGAVVHLAGEPVDGRWTQAKREAIRASRVDGTRRLVDALVGSPARPAVLVSASAIGYYGDRGDEELDEDSAPGGEFLSEVARAWEAEARRATEHGVRVVCVRFGIILGRGGGALARLLPIARLGAGGPLGSGRQWWSWVHMDDVCGLLVHALDGDASGALNATAPAAVRQRDFARELGGALHRPAFVPAPAFALRLALGGFSSELLTSKRVLPRRSQEAGYRFRHPDLDAALAGLLAR